MTRYLHIGTDEAGYGPTLGPLVITATSWSSTDVASPDSWYARLGPEVVTYVPKRGQKPGHSSRPTEGHNSPSPICITDSKRLYNGTQDLPQLESAAWAILGQSFPIPFPWRDILSALDPEALSWVDKVPWCEHFPESLPAFVHADQARTDADRFRTALVRAGLQLEGVRLCFIPAGRFNELLQVYGRKSELLSHTTLALVKTLLTSGTTTMVWSDKHGARNSYSAHLHHAFPTAPISIRCESAEQSVYEVGGHVSSWRFTFRAKGEALFVIAASSLVSKYFRELEMWAFNRYWQVRKPGLRPTAGYPQDARRFLAEIGPDWATLGLPISWLCRQK